MVDAAQSANKQDDEKLYFHESEAREVEKPEQEDKLVAVDEDMSGWNEEFSTKWSLAFKDNANDDRELIAQGTDIYGNTHLYDSNGNELDDPSAGPGRKPHWWEKPLNILGLASVFAGDGGDMDFEGGETEGFGTEVGEFVDGFDGGDSVSGGDGAQQGEVDVAQQPEPGNPSHKPTPYEFIPKEQRQAGRQAGLSEEEVGEAYAMGARTPEDFARYNNRTQTTNPPGKMNRPGNQQAAPDPYKPGLTYQLQTSYQGEVNAANALAREGYDVHWWDASARDEMNTNPLNPNATPDLIIDGNEWDVYSPNNSDPAAVSKEVKHKVNHQAPRVVVNLDHTSLSKEGLLQHLENNPIEGLEELIIVQGGQTYHYVPFSGN